MKSKLIFIYSVVLLYLILIGLTHLSPHFVPLVLISMGFILGFMANETFFKEDGFTFNNKYSIIEGDTLSNIRTNCKSCRKMPSDPPPSLLYKKETNLNYKSVTELCAENSNLAEYIEQLEKEIKKIEKLKLSVEKLILLHHELVLHKGESEEADKIRNELDELAKHIPEEQEWMRKLSASLYDLEDNKILDTYPIKLKTVDKMKVKYVQGKN